MLDYQILVSGYASSVVVNSVCISITSITSSDMTIQMPQPNRNSSFSTAQVSVFIFNNSVFMLSFYSLLHWFFNLLASNLF